MGDSLRICLVSSEIAPFAKTGGLADVAAALGRFLRGAGHDVRLVMPMYAGVRDGPWDLLPEPALQDVPVTLGPRRLWFSASWARLPGSRTEVWFVRCPELYDRPEIYTLDEDEPVRFALLSLAAAMLCQYLRWSPDVVHCNDWHAGLLPLWLRTRFVWDRLFESTRTVLTIHNAGYQGTFSADVVAALGLEEERRLLHQESLARGRFGFLETGILWADAITTVSETYAREIQTPEQGMGLEGCLRARADSLYGIVNGVDYAEWDPAKDARIPHRYSVGDLSGKREDKRALLERFQLDVDLDAPLLGIVSRLTAQKGLELAADVLPAVLQRHDVRIVVLGSGEAKYERWFQWLRDEHPERVGVYLGYDEELAHWIEAGSDVFLMPSRYEPCGLNQMYSLKYGTVPVVRATGGLADTVEPFDPTTGEGTGFLFSEFSAQAFFAALQRALHAYRDRAAWERLVKNGMRVDFSWRRQGRRYLELYESLRAGAVQR